MIPMGSYMRDYLAEARAKKIERATHLRQLAKKSRKPLSQSEQNSIRDAAFKKGK